MSESRCTKWHIDDEIHPVDVGIRHKHISAIGIDDADGYAKEEYENKPSSLDASGVLCLRLFHVFLGDKEFSLGKVLFGLFSFLKKIVAI